MLIARTATYNGAPRSRQRWTETYHRGDGPPVTLRFLLLEDGHESVTVAEPSTRYRRRPARPAQGVLAL